MGIAVFQYSNNVVPTCCPQGFLHPHDLTGEMRGAAIYKNGVVEVIPSDQGNRLMPSVVAFDGSAVMVGEAAKHLACHGGDGYQVCQHEGYANDVERVDIYSLKSP